MHFKPGDGKEFADGEEWAGLSYEALQCVDSLAHEEPAQESRRCGC